MRQRTESGWYFTEHDADGNMAGAVAQVDGRVAIQVNGRYGHQTIFVRPSMAKQITDVIQEATIEAMAVVKDSTP